VAKDTNRYHSAGPAAARFVAQMMLMKPYIWSMINVHVHGRQHLDALKPPFIAIANHSSHLDAPLVFGSLPRRLSKNLAAGAAADYFFNQWYKSLSTTLFFNSFPVVRRGYEGKAGRHGMANDLLADGVPLLVFPEGTRSRTGAMSSFTPGAAALSISRDVPIVPLALVGAYAAMPYGAGLPLSGRPAVHVVIGRPLHAAPGERAMQFADRLHRYVVEMHDTTARAYGMPTQADFARAVALREAAAKIENAEREERRRAAEMAVGEVDVTDDPDAEPSPE